MLRSKEGRDSGRAASVGSPSFIGDETMRFPKFKVTALVVVLLMAGTATFADLKDTIVFGNCFVSTSVDDSSDEIQWHYVTCDDGTDATAVVAICHANGDYGVLFASTGVSLPVSELVAYEYRFDKGMINTGRAMAFGVHNIEISGKERFEEVTEGIASSKQVTFKLGGKSSRLEFSRVDGLYAVGNLRARCGALERDS